MSVPSCEARPFPRRVFKPETQSSHRVRSLGLGQVEVLRRVSRILNSSHGLETVLALVMDEAIEFTGAERGLLLLTTDELSKVYCLVGRDLDRHTLDSEEFSLSRTILEDALQSHRGRLVADAKTDDRYSPSESIEALELRSVMAVPLRLADATIGALYLDSRAVSGLFTAEDLDCLGAFADVAAVAIHNALLTEEVSLLEDRTEQEQDLEEALRLRDDFLESLGGELKLLEHDLTGQIEALDKGRKTKARMKALGASRDRLRQLADDLADVAGLRNRSS